MQEIQVNFTIATGADPDVKIASTNCHNSHVLLRNYELDKTGQAERDELAQVRRDIEMYERLTAFTKTLINSQAMVTTDENGFATLLSPQPSPPPPPPPVPELDPHAPMHPPAPPSTVSGQMLITRYEGFILDLEAQEVELVLKLDDCFVKDRAEGTVCGLNSNEAPDPWMAIGGVKCLGYDTRSTREGDYCGYWESDMNPMAAEKKLRQELLAVGPFCFAYSDEPTWDDDNRDQATGIAPPLLDRFGDVVYKRIVAYCSPNSTRTQRSGVTDVEYMIRPDREFCEFKFARQRLASESGDDIELCRANLTARIAKCHLNCDACSAWCTSKAVREIASVAKCSVALPVLGMLQAQHSSDLGLDIGFRWGAKRYDMRPANPSNSWNEKYRILVQNSVGAPMAPRNSISCRCAHLPALCASACMHCPTLLPTTQEAAPRVERRHLPPAARRGGQPRGAQGLPRAVQHRPGLLQPLRNSSRVGHALCVLAQRLNVHDGRLQQGRVQGAGGGQRGAQGRRRAAPQDLAARQQQRGLLPDRHARRAHAHRARPAALLTRLPHPLRAGDDRYDSANSFGTGVCTDVHYDYMHTGCESQIGAQVTMGLTSCWPKAHPRGSVLCGVLVDIDEDYVHSVGIDIRSLIFPRVLVEEAQVNGITQQRIVCYHELDCMDKCDHYARKAHSGGLPSPPACALCSPPCPNNIAETVLTAVRALGYDIISAIRLAALCLNPVACVCQVSHAAILCALNHAPAHLFGTYKLQTRQLRRSSCCSSPRGSTTCPTSSRSAPRPTS